LSLVVAVLSASLLGIPVACSTDRGSASQHEVFDREDIKMRRQLRPRIELLETKNLLSHVAVPVIGAPATHFPPVERMPPTLLLTASLTTNQRIYTAGQVVRMTFTETNNTGHDVYVNIGPSIDGFYITEGGRTIWRSNSGPQPEFIVRRLLLPGQSIKLTANWTVSAGPGTYVVHNQMDPLVTAEFAVIQSPPIASAASAHGASVAGAIAPAGIRKFGGPVVAPNGTLAQ
jgi:hypothetical protein